MSEGIEQGRVQAVRVVQFGSYLTQAHAQNDTTLFLEDVADFNQDGGFVEVNGVQYEYDAVDFDADTLHLVGSGLSAAAAEDDRADVFPLTVEKQAIVLLEDFGDTVTVRVPHSLYPAVEEGINVETGALAAQIMLDGDEWVLDDLPGHEPFLDGSVINPITLPPANLPNNPPPSSPAPTVVGGIGSLHVRWAPIDHDTPFKVQVHISTTDGFTATLNDSATLAGSSVNGTSFTIESLPDGSPLVPGQPYYVRTIAHNSAGVAAASAQGEGQLRLVDTPDISVEALWAGQVVADSIIGGNLNVDVGLVGSITATGAAGESVQMSGDGFFVRGATGLGNPVLVEFPTDGTKPNIVSGTLEASTLQVNGASLFLDDGAWGNGVNMTLSNAVASPQAAPSVQSTYDTTSQVLEAPSPPSGTTGWRFITPGGVASDGTHLYWTGKPAGEEDYYLNKSRLDGGTTGNASVKFNTGLTSQGRPNRVPMGPVVIAGKVYVPARAYTEGSDTDDLVMRRYDAATLSFETQVTLTSNFFSRSWHTAGVAEEECGWAACTATDGTDVFVGFADAPNADFNVRRYNTSGTQQEVITSTYTINPHFLGTHTYTLSLMVGTFDFGATRYLLNDGRFVRSFSKSGSTLSRVSNEDFEVPVVSPPGIGEQLDLGDYGTACYFWDGSRFCAIDHNFDSTGGWTEFAVWRHSTTKWTTESAKWWVSQTVWDSVNLHETTQSPKASIGIMRKRSWLKVTTAANGIGGSRVYVGRGSTEPALSGMFRQATLTGGVTATTIDGVTFSGSNPPSTNGFPAAVPAKIVSQFLSPADGNPAIELGGDGVAKFDTVLLRGTSDANNTAGNTPALRVGDITGNHLRVDGNEIISMASDTTQGVLFTNRNGETRVADGTGGSLRIGTQGKAMTRVAFGRTTITTNGSGEDSITHGLGTIPLTIIAEVHNDNARKCNVFDRTTSNFTVRIVNLSGTANVVTNASVVVAWIAIADD